MPGRLVRRKPRDSDQERHGGHCWCCLRGLEMIARLRVRDLFAGDIGRLRLLAETDPELERSLSRHMVKDGNEAASPSQASYSPEVRGSSCWDRRRACVPELLPPCSLGRPGTAVHEEERRAESGTERTPLGGTQAARLISKGSPRCMRRLLPTNPSTWRAETEGEKRCSGQGLSATEQA